MSKERKRVKLAVRAPVQARVVAPVVDACSTRRPDRTRLFRLCKGEVVPFDARARVNYLSLLGESRLCAELSCEEELCAPVVVATCTKGPFRTTIGDAFVRRQPLFACVNREIQLK